MKIRALPITSNSLFIWLLLAFLTLMDALGLVYEGMSLTPTALFIIFLPVGLIAGLAAFYTYIRKSGAIATTAHIAAVTLAFMSASAILSYIAVTLREPLIDPTLVRADRALGLDWPSMYAWVLAHPFLHKIMKLIYISLIPEIFILQFILVVQGQKARAWELLWLFTWTCLVCIVMSGIWPAIGAFGYFQIDGQSYVQEFMSLRDGTYKIIGSHGGMQGVVQFPSLHMALALIYPYACRGRPILFPVVTLFNLLIIATTPPIGGHHFADLWGGAVLAVAVMALSRTQLFPKTEMPA